MFEAMFQNIPAGSVGWSLIVAFLGGVGAIILQQFRNNGIRVVADIAANVSLTEQASITLLEIVKEIKSQNRFLIDENSLLKETLRRNDRLLELLVDIVRASGHEELREAICRASEYLVELGHRS